MAKPILIAVAALGISLFFLAPAIASLHLLMGLKTDGESVVEPGDTITILGTLTGVGEEKTASRHGPLYRKLPG